MVVFKSADGLVGGNKQRIAIVGFDLDILDLAESCGCVVDGCFDAQDRGRITYLGNDNEGASYQGKVVFGPQAPSAREKLWPIYSGRVVGLISPTAHVSDRAEIGTATTIHHGVMIFPEARIGHGVQIHPGAFVHHESVVGDFVTLSPRALILGRVTLGRGVFVGAGAIVKEHVTVSDGVTIGAGAVVLNDVAEGNTVAGVPARALAK